jgi:hypothetical protein
MYKTYQGETRYHQLSSGHPQLSYNFHPKWMVCWWWVAAAGSQNGQKTIKDWLGLT